MGILEEITKSLVCLSQETDNEEIKAKIDSIVDEIGDLGYLINDSYSSNSVYAELKDSFRNGNKLSIQDLMDKYGLSFSQASFFFKILSKDTKIQHGVVGDGLRVSKIDR